MKREEFEETLPMVLNPEPVMWVDDTILYELNIGRNLHRIGCSRTKTVDFNVPVYVLPGAAHEAAKASSEALRSLSESSRRLQDALADYIDSDGTKSKSELADAVEANAIAIVEAAAFIGAHSHAG